MSELDRIADYVIEKLKAAGFILQRYDSITTASIYLKLDYGVSNSIRISDHKGKKHLHYRDNLIKNRNGIGRAKSPEGWPQYYYPFTSVKVMIKEMIAARDAKVKRYGQAAYDRLKVKNLADKKSSAGFWRNCKMI